MKVIVIDGQGGGIGRSVIEALKKVMPNIFIVAVGTNALATSNMLKGGAAVGATGENAIVFNADDADVIIGPVGISFTNAMYGEITKEMAVAVGASKAKKYLIPVSKLNLYIPGIQEMPIQEYIRLIIDQVQKDMNNL